MILPALVFWRCPFQNSVKISVILLEIFVVFVSHLKQMPSYCLKLVHTHFLSHIVQCIIHYCPTIQCCSLNCWQHCYINIKCTNTWNNYKLKIVYVRSLLYYIADTCLGLQACSVYCTGYCCMYVTLFFIQGINLFWISRMYINSIQFITRFRYYLSCMYVIFIKKCLINSCKS